MRALLSRTEGPCTDVSVSSHQDCRMVGQFGFIAGHVLVLEEWR